MKKLQGAVRDYFVHSLKKQHKMKRQNEHQQKINQI